METQKAIFGLGNNASHTSVKAQLQKLNINKYIQIQNDNVEQSKEIYN